MKFCKCGEEIPEKRIELGYSTCVACSTTKKFSGHLIVHHKTGNEYEVIKDPETAHEMKRMTRAGFGSRRKGGKFIEETVVVKKRVVKSVQPTSVVFVLQKTPADSSKWKDDEWGTKIVEVAEKSKMEATDLLEEVFQMGEMSPDCRKRILYILQLDI
jgi:hypothetical protein